MSHRENESSAITLLLLIVLLFLMLVGGAGVLFWLRSIRSVELRNSGPVVETTSPH